jgi:hypothetical protein
VPAPSEQAGSPATLQPPSPAWGSGSAISLSPEAPPATPLAPGPSPPAAPPPVAKVFSQEAAGTRGMQRSKWGYIAGRGSTFTHFTHPLRVHHLPIFPPVLLRGRILLPFPHLPRPFLAHLSVAYIALSSCATGDVDSVAVLPLRFPFLVFCLFDYALQYFRLCNILYQAMHVFYFFVPIRCEIGVPTWARRQRVLCAAGIELLTYC